MDQDPLTAILSCPDKAVVLRVVSTLHLVCANTLKAGAPRSLRLTNPSVMAKLLGTPSALPFLRSVGFLEDGERLVMPDGVGVPAAAVARLGLCEGYLTAGIAAAPARAAAVATARAATAAAAAAGEMLPAIAVYADIPLPSTATKADMAAAEAVFNDRTSCGLFGAQNPVPCVARANGSLGYLPRPFLAATFYAKCRSAPFKSSLISDPV